MKYNMSILLLFAVFGLSAQPKISFEKSQHDFGKVEESLGTVSHDFTFTNTGSAPLIIQNVSTTCGCTTPEWTKQPIRPGETGFIKVSYEAKGRAGAIDKTITVHSNSSPSTTNLRIVGEVIPVDRQPSEAYRYPAGPIKLNDMHVAFKRMYSYEKPALIVSAYNPGAEAVTISFINLPAHIKADVMPATIKQGEKANIRVTYDAARKNDWGDVIDQISMILNNDKTQEYKLTVTATIVEDFSRWTTSQLQNAPTVSLEQQTIDGGQIKKGEKKTYIAKLTNNGKSQLIVRKIDSGKQLKVDSPKEINAGASAELKITFDSSEQTGEQTKTVTLITNDPKNAQITIRLKVNVVD